MLAKPAYGETLNLNEATRSALTYASSVSAATAQSDLNAAMVREVRALLYPPLSAGSEYMQLPGYNAAVTNGGLSNALPTLNYTAYDFGRQLPLARAALYQNEAARYGVRTAQVQVAFDTTVAYYDLLRARETEHEPRSNATRLMRYLAVTRALQSSGRAIANDVLKVETTVNSANLALATGQSASARALVALGALIGDFEHSSGQIVNELDPLADLIDPASVYVEAQVQIDDLRAIEPGMGATVTSSLSPSALYPARVVALSPSFSTGGTISLVGVAFVGRDKIWEADPTGEVRVTTKYAPEAIAIPAAALFQDVERGGFYVFTVSRDDRAHCVTVTVGIHDADRVQLTSGVKPGELVITSSGYALSDGLPVRVVAGGA